MKKLFQFAVLAFAQTATTVPAPVWFTVATTQQQALTLSVTLPAGTIYRIGDSKNNKWCVQPVPTASITIVDYADGLNGRPADCDPGTAKELDVQETPAAQSVTLTNSAVKPAAVTPITVPALPAPLVVTINCSAPNVTMAMITSGQSFPATCQAVPQ
jgi:hypothetical protein